MPVCEDDAPLGVHLSAKRAETAPLSRSAVPASKPTPSEVPLSSACRLGRELQRRDDGQVFSGSGLRKEALVCAEADGYLARFSRS